MLHDLDFTKERPLIEFSNNDMDKLSFFCFDKDNLNIEIATLIYEELNKTIQERKIPMHQIMRDEALKAFEIWSKKTDKIKY